MSTVIQLPSQSKIKQASRINGQNLKAKWILLNGLQAQVICSWDLVVLVESLSFNAQDIDVLFDYQSLKECLLPDFLVNHGRALLFYSFDFGQVYLFEPHILRVEVNCVEELLLLHSTHEIPVYQPVECFHIVLIRHNGLLICFYCHYLVLLGLIALASDEVLA